MFEFASSCPPWSGLLSAHDAKKAIRAAGRKQRFIRFVSYIRVYSILSFLTARGIGREPYRPRSRLPDAGNSNCFHSRGWTAFRENWPLLKPKRPRIRSGHHLHKKYCRKDRHPFPMPLKVYDETSRVLKSAMRKARLGQGGELVALRRLDDEARRLERLACGPSLEELMAQEQNAHIPMEAGARSAGRRRRLLGAACGHDPLSPGSAAASRQTQPPSTM